MSKLHEDLLVTALEGGSNYWYYIKSLEMIWDTPSNLPTSTRIYQAVMNNGVEIEIHDIEDEDERLGVISKEGILSALSKLKTIAPHIYDDIIDDAWDAESADAWFQLVVMGEIVYG